MNESKPQHQPGAIPVQDRDGQLRDRSAARASRRALVKIAGRVARRRKASRADIQFAELGGEG